MAEWQPIETAPKDGTEILVCYPRQGNVMALVHYDTIWSQWKHKGDSTSVAGTVWMPKPLPPGVTEAQATRCGYCAQDMVPGSECRTSDAAKSCEMYQRFAATVKVDTSGVALPLKGQPE